MPAVLVLSYDFRGKLMILGKKVNLLLIINGHATNFTGKVNELLTFVSL